MTWSSVFIHFEASKIQDIGTAYTEMHHQGKKPLYTKDFRLFFNDKKKTVGRYDCINPLFLIWCGRQDLILLANYARRSVTALTVHRTVIHYRSPSNPVPIPNRKVTNLLACHFFVALNERKGQKSR